MAPRHRRIHRLKTWPLPFQAAKHDLKPFEIRKDDRGYQVDDFLVLDEWNAILGKYTDERPLVRVVTYLLPEGFGLADGYVAMGLDKLSSKDLEVLLLEVAPARPTPPSSNDEGTKR